MPRNLVVAVGSAVASFAYKYLFGDLPPTLPVQDGAILSRVVYRGGAQPPTPWNKALQQLDGFEEYDDYFEAADVPAAACEDRQQRSTGFLSRAPFEPQRSSQDDLRQCQLDLEPEVMLAASLWSLDTSIPFYVICSRDETCSGLFYKGDSIVRTGMNADMGSPTKWRVRKAVGTDRGSLLSLIRQLSAKNITREEYYETIRIRLECQFDTFDQEKMDESRHLGFKEIVRWNSAFFYRNNSALPQNLKRPAFPALTIPPGHLPSEFMKADQADVLTEISAATPVVEQWNEVLIAATGETVAGFWSEDLTYACLLREDFHSRYPLMKDKRPAFLLVRESNSIQDVTSQCQSVVQACNSDRPPSACSGQRQHKEVTNIQREKPQSRGRCRTGRSNSFEFI